MIYVIGSSKYSAQSQGCVGSPCLSQPSTIPLIPSLPGLNDVDPNLAPASMTIDNSMTQDMGYYKFYYYQLNNVYGDALTGPGYEETEWITGDNPGDVNSNGQYSAVQNGVFGADRVGFSAPPNSVSNQVTYQNFPVIYEGTIYNLSTVFQHTIQSTLGYSNGSIGYIPFINVSPVVP